MLVDIGDDISGVKPSLLKVLLRKEKFTTPDAMKIFNIPEPLASRTLAHLAENGWISFEGTKDFVDQWRRSNSSLRFIATKLIKRTPRQQGWRIVDQIIEAVRRINADHNYSQRVKTLILFGSLLSDTGPDVGDVDLVVTLAERPLPPDELKNLTKAELQHAPNSVRISFFQSLTWPSHRLLREIRKVSRILSLHPESDLKATGAAHKVIYRFDVSADRELPVEGTIVAASPPEMTNSQDPVRLPTSLATVQPVPWPAIPNERTEFRIDEANTRLAQHMWVNGAPLSVIAERCRDDLTAEPDTAKFRAILAHQAAGPLTYTPVFDASLRVMIRDALVSEPHHNPLTVITEVRLTRRSWNASTWIHDAATDDWARAWEASPGWVVRGADEGLRRAARAVHAATVAWVKRARPKLSELNAFIKVFILNSDHDLVQRGATMPDLGTLAPTMCRALASDRHVDWRRQRYDVRLVCHLRRGGGDVRLEANEGDPGSARRLRSSAATRQMVQQTQQKLLGSDDSWLAGFDEFVVWVDPCYWDEEPREGDDQTT